jgi:hypothetical protein
MSELAQEFEGMAKAHKAMGEAEEAEKYSLAANALRKIDVDAIKKAIDAAFSAKGLYIDWQLRDSIIEAILR